MRLPRDWSGADLVQRLARVGYEQTRQRGSHVRLTKVSPDGTHHVTVPLHNPIRLGTLNSILRDVAAHLGMSRDELLKTLTK